MSDPASPPPPPQPITMPWRQSLAARLRNYFLAGLLVTAPISITLYFAWLVVDYIDSAVTGLIPAHYNPNTYLPFAIPGLGLLILAVVLTVVGFLTANFLGRMMVRLGERIVARLPVIRSFYGAVKQIFETVFSKHTQSFREVVLVEFPRKDMWALGLVIGKSAAEIQITQKATVPPEELYSVFIPTMSFTSGYLVFLPRKDMRTVEMTVEECLKMIVSGGIVMPTTKPEAVTDIH
ncbi:MAG: DUF502 domain-containing protein [Rhodospirillaceae bacterium]|nr:DUF502 domain-containing protein [Rhodospirillaceae bacterium]